MELKKSGGATDCSSTTDSVSSSTGVSTPFPPPRVGQATRGNCGRGLRPQVLLALRSRPLRSGLLGRGRRSRRHEIFRGHQQTPRGVLPLGFAAYRLQGDQNARCTRPSESHGRGLSPARHEGRVLPLSHRLASPGLRHRRPALHAQPPRPRTAQRRAPAEKLHRVSARPGTGAVDPVRPRRPAVLRFQLPAGRAWPLPGSHRQGTRRLGQPRAHCDDPQAAAGHPRQRPAGPARGGGRLGLHDPRAVLPRDPVAVAGGRCCGKHARPSPAPGATTATRHPGRASNNWFAC